MQLRAWMLTTLLAGCGHLAPATTEGVPPPWPAPDAPVSQHKAAAPAPPPEPEGKPVVPPMKREVPVPPAPNVPQSAPAG